MKRRPFSANSNLKGLRQIFSWQGSFDHGVPCHVVCALGEKSWRPPSRFLPIPVSANTVIAGDSNPVPYKFYGL